MVWLYEINISDAPILYALLPAGKAFAHERTMLGLIQRHNVIGYFQIDDSTLLRKSTRPCCNYAALPQAVQGKWRHGSNVVSASFDREGTGLRPPMCRHVSRTVIEQLLGEAASVKVAGAKEKNAFHIRFPSGKLPRPRGRLSSGLSTSRVLRGFPSECVGFRGLTL